jgi:hypothetical protein
MGKPRHQRQRQLSSKAARTETTGHVRKHTSSKDQ